MSKKIIININKNGSAELQVTGASGGNCLKMTQQLEDTLGDVLSVSLTDDYYSTFENNQQIQAQQ